MKKTLLKNVSICLFLFLFLINFFIPLVNADAENDITIYSPSALLMDLTTGKILYQKNINEKMYPASLTKIMTAILVLEKCDLGETATVSYDAVMNLSYGYVTANLQIGEELTVEQLLNVLLVGSSNDAAIVLAEHVSGSIEDFSNLMNEKALELGCTSTHFINPNGVHDESHYSSAYDLALMAKYAMQNEVFRNIVSKTIYTLPATNKYDREDRFFTNTNALLTVNNNNRADNYYYKYATGIKTGFTTPAQNCLVASANKENLELLTVVLGSTQTDDGLSQRYLDTINLFEYGYNNYCLKEVVKEGEAIQTINISHATRDTKKLDVVVQNDVYVLIKSEDKNISLLPKIELTDNLKAPIVKGEKIGFVTYNIDGIDYTENLLASKDVKRSKFFINFLVFILILIILLICFRYKKRKRKNRRLKYKIR